MSPYETLPLPHTETSVGSSDTVHPLLQEHAITRNGFLPETQPLGRLPHPYYSPWESLVGSLAASIQDRTLRPQVDRLPVLSTEYLTTEPEWRRACVVLGFLTHGYVWGGDVAAEVLPPSIAVPLLAVSDHLGIPPVATYACVNLWNFRSTSPALDLTDLDALHALHTFTGTRDESWFYVVSVAMEARGAAIIPTMLDALASLTARDLPAATAALASLTACIAALGALLARMDENCRPLVFYHRIRPFLAGSKNMAAAGLPNGVFYHEGDGDGDGDGDGRAGQWRQLRGGSNGQSSLIQFLDLVLGVEHTAHGNSNPDKPQEMSFHEEVRGYMPAPHRRFLQHVAETYPGGMRQGVAELLEGGRLSVEQGRLQDAFQTATRTLAEFRNQHLQMVARYIIIPSRQPNGDQGVNLATASSRLKTESGAKMATSGGELTGTGGTALLPFLKQSRDETSRAGEFPCRV
ncbi:Indoleamine 2,3-dioxygenase [Trichocladium antarcticum]|uniref:Indoleamine 2,3-dioxygenase n=1 Tax=Trichocladium antarcticum TaxID=1450529 RepID=A0AAN6ZA75_9PEZI|nr:Indoleamine 2,3-dioxygenase [Trichocladium antarcticum]